MLLSEGQLSAAINSDIRKSVTNQKLYLKISLKNKGENVFIILV